MAKTYAIAIDGPAGAGKSTLAKKLAKELGYQYVDTGAIYRTVAYFMDLWGVSPKNGMDVTEDIRANEISQKASLISAHGIVREMLLDMQRDVAKQYNVIMDGRDIGTVVLPKANVKFFLTASAEVRAKRRTAELQAKGQKASFNQILKEIQQRDFQDTHREIAPLKLARDSVKLDTSDMTIDEVVAEMKRIVAEKIPL